MHALVTGFYGDRRTRLEEPVDRNPLGSDLGGGHDVRDAVQRILVIVAISRDVALERLLHVRRALPGYPVPTAGAREALTMILGAWGGDA